MTVHIQEQQDQQQERNTTVKSGGRAEELRLPETLGG